MKTPQGWKRPFDDAIPLPRGRSLVTLEDAGAYITKLPKVIHEAAEWQAAMEGLILVATLGGPVMFARIGVMRALNRHVERVFNPDRKNHHWAAGSWRGIDDPRGGPAPSIPGGAGPNRAGLNESNAACGHNARLIAIASEALNRSANEERKFLFNLGSVLLRELRTS
jgi:hypothetical protein